MDLHETKDVGVVIGYGGNCGSTSSAGTAGWRPTPTSVSPTGRSPASSPGNAAPAAWRQAREAISRQEPISDPDGHWPCCDDQQNPASASGRRVTPTLAALLAHLEQHDHDQDLDDDPAWPGEPAPVVAVRVRATVGRPGAAAQATYRRRRAAEWVAWTRGLPWRRRRGRRRRRRRRVRRAARPSPGRPGGPAGRGLAGLGAAFRVSAGTRAWRRGAVGEQRTARLPGRLEQRGWVVLHDLAVPGSAANIDHLAIGPGGVVVIDSKQYRGRLDLDPDGLLWHGRHPLTMAPRAVRWEADQADEVLGVADIDVASVMAVHGASVPWGRVVVSGVTVAPADRVPDLLRALPKILGPERVAWLADRARLRFRPAA